MSLNLSDLKKDRRTVTVEIGSQSFDVTYRPFALTPEREEELASLDPESSERWLQFFVEIVSDWDVKTSANGKKVPVTVEGIKQVPSKVLVQALEAVTEDTRGNPPSGGTSDDS